MVDRFFMKLFRTSNVAIVRQCQELFGFQLPSIALCKRVDKFVFVNITLLIICCAKYVANLYKLSCVLIDIYCWCHNLCYFTAVYLYCFLICYCFYNSLVNKDFQKLKMPAFSVDASGKTLSEADD